MDLILWRHAEAEPGEPDLGRRLTAKGIQQAERMGKWLDRHLPATTRILSSPADRTQQTARALNSFFFFGARFIFFTVLVDFFAKREFISFSVIFERNALTYCACALY